MVKKRNIKKRKNIKKKNYKRSSSNSSSTTSIGSIDSIVQKNNYKVIQEKTIIKNENVDKAKKMERTLEMWNHDQMMKGNTDAVWIPDEMRSYALHSQKDRVFIGGDKGYDGESSSGIGGYRYLVFDFGRGLIYEETYHVTSNRTTRRNPRNNYAKDLTLLRKVFGKDLQGLKVYSGKESYSYED